MTTSGQMLQVCRRVFLVATGLVLASGLATSADAGEPAGKLRILNWMSGAEAKMWTDIEAAFAKAHPGVEVSDLKIPSQGDARGGIRSALMGGEVVDLMINTWPAFREELVAANMLAPIDGDWDASGWDKRLSPSWREISKVGGTTYGVPFLFGDRSGIWYKTAHMKKAGIEPPKTWSEFLASFDKLKAAGYAHPVAMPGKFWAHAEWFESLLVRVSGVETASKLAKHEIPWTDPAIKAVLKKYAEMIDAGCCGDASVMLAGDWDYEADRIFKADAKNYELMGMWMNARLISDYGLKDGVDFGLFQFPALGLGHDDTSIVDTKEVNLAANAPNREAAIAFMDFLSSRTVTDILADYGLASPSLEADTSKLGPSQQTATAAALNGKVQFVFGDLLPGDMADEYRVQLQKFLLDTSDANIDTVLAALEAKAKSIY